MNILIACEFSGMVRDSFIKLGYNAMSCDLKETETPGSHYKGDVLDVLEDEWDLMIAHPPCTHLSVSGARWFKNKKELQVEALEFVRVLMGAPIKRICIENPVSIISTKIRKPDQIIQPYEHGDPYRKTTCLWLKNLPNLKPTNIVEPKLKTYKDGSTFSADYGWSSNKKRSVTYQGIADAMAKQWGDNIYQIQEKLTQ